MAKLQLKAEPPKITIGDTVRIGIAVQEAKGKVRTQNLEGVILAEHSSGINKTFTFRRVFQGIGIHLIIPLHAPVLKSLEVLKRGRVRRAKLYYLKYRVGKAAKLKEIVPKSTKVKKVPGSTKVAEAKAAEAKEATL